RGAAVVADLEDLRDRSFVTGKSRYVAICDRVTRVRRERRYRGCEPIRIMNSITRKTARMPAQVPSKKLDVVEDNQKCRRRIAKASVDNMTLDALEILEQGWMYLRHLSADSEQSPRIRRRGYPGASVDYLPVIAFLPRVLTDGSNPRAAETTLMRIRAG